MMDSHDNDASSRSEQLPSVEDVRMYQADRRQSATSTSGGSSASKVSDIETAFPDSDSETGYVHDQLPSVEDIQMNGAPRRGGRAKCFLLTTILVIVTIVGVSVAVALVKQGGGASDEEFPMELSGSNNNVPFYEPPVTINDTPAPVNPTPVTDAPQQPEESEPATATTFPPETPTDTVPPAASTEEEAAARLQKIMELISSAGVSDMEQMQTFGTPQQTAAIWMAESDPTPVSLDNTNAVIEQYAVLVFFFATNGSNWPNQLNFKTSGGVCQWYINGFASDKQTARKYGVTCDKDGSVNTIHIPSNFLSGVLPTELSALANMERFEVFNNPGLMGGFPVFFNNMPKVNYIGIHYCGLTGQIPEWIGSVTSLRSLVLSNNNFEGSLPAGMSSLTLLEDLYLDDNNVSGDIAVLKSLSSIKHLVLEDNILEGQLTDEMVQNWQNLEVLDISHNRIAYSIPAALFSLPNVKILDLHGNSLSGSIPAPTGSNTVLEILTLNENELFGPVPSELGTFVNLKQLDVSRNKLTSTLPDSLSALKQLEFFYAAENPLNAAAIPSFLAQLTALKELSLKNTQCVDTIPDWFGGLSSLKLLDLDNNRLVGTIPDSLASATALEYLLLQRNELTGEIPASLSALDKLAFFMVDKNKLKGSVAPVCSATENARFFSADCAGDVPEVVCPCCSICCGDGDSECNDKLWLADSNPIWELDYQRQGVEFDASASQTYTVAFGGQIQGQP